MIDFQRLQTFYSQNKVRIWMYLAIALSFGIFFTIVMENGNSRYNIRLRETDARIDSRMNMMRREYLYQDSVFRHELDSLHKLDSAKEIHEH